MKRLPLPSLCVLPLVFACSDDGKSADTATGSSSAEHGDGDGDTPGDGDPGDRDPGDGDGDPACTPGELDCECNAGQCLGDLECVNNTCVASCIPGELGCECNAGQCLGDLECFGDVCTDPNCIPGELGCECNGGQCLGSLECVGNVCMEASGDGDGDGDGDPPCPNPNEMMCDGQCIDVMENNDNCGSCGTVCNWLNKGAPDIGSCVDGDCLPTFYPCYSQADGFINCDEMCASFGETCVNNGCDFNTHVYTDSMNICNGGLVGGQSSLGCGQPIGWLQGDWVGCCCTQ
ncbi:hypothetical protein [Enhygromyxa salina]|uniref:Uncharacterized protein n=1 Tax=Enhygromyxa salina TaxID=215803 RepID=A0A2S9YTE0_9BACT|nr:hypothetical protein [Enhygromyxa salina]PRQ08356.1 hypothetical protein ENSA7_19830 [Enhygromyxa salina]